MVIHYCNLEEHSFSYYCYTVFFFLLLEKMKHKEVISLEHTEVGIAGNRQSDFQGPKGPSRSPYITAVVFTGQCVNEEVGIGFL